MQRLHARGKQGASRGWAVLYAGMELDVREIFVAGTSG